MAKPIDTVYWLEKSHWLIISFSVIAAVVALIAEGPGQYIGLTLVGICVVVISAWSLNGKPSLNWMVAIVVMAILVLGWTVEEPESALFQSILVTAAVGWRVDRLWHSVALLVLLVFVPLIGDLGPNEADWAWWNWSVGTLFMWSLGRVIRLLEQTLKELTDARVQLINSARKNAAKEERLRISRDIHDLVGHSLTAMLLNIRAAQRTLVTSDSEAHQALHDAERVGTAGIADIRATLADMRNDSAATSHAYDTLSSLPDGETVLSLLSRQENIHVTYCGDVTALDGPLAIVVYRILQECITNILKYAGDGTATIDLTVKSNEVIIAAMNPLSEENESNQTFNENSLGLIGMRERATSLGGSFRAGAERDAWKVNCRLPRHG